MARQSLERAEDWRMGVWANGASQEAIYWFIKERIPVFNAHKCNGEDLKYCVEADRSSDIVLGSDITRLHPKQNYLESLARGMTLKNPSSDPWVYPAEILKDTDPELHWEEESRNAASPAIPPIAHSPIAPTKNVPARHPSQVLDLIILWDECVPWIRPPEISKVKAGSWERWALDVEDGVESLRRMKSNDEGHVYYDRKHRRILTLEYALVSPPGLTTDCDCFSLPAPDMPYEIRVENIWQPTTRSCWLYLSKYPTKEHLETQMIEPTPDKLLLLSSAKGKTTAVFESMMDLDDNNEALGSDHEDDIFKVSEGLPTTTSPRPESPIPMYDEGVVSTSEVTKRATDIRMENATPATDAPSTIRDAPTLQSELQPDDSVPPEQMDSLLPMQPSIPPPPNQMEHHQDSLSGAVETSRAELPTTYLTVSNTPDIIAKLADFCELYDMVVEQSEGGSYQQVLRTMEDREQTFWLEMNSTDDAQRVKECLINWRMQEDAVLLCSFVSEKNFWLAKLNSAEMWSAKSGGKRTRSPLPSRHCRRQDSPPTLVCRFRSRSPSRGVPLMQRISDSVQPAALLRRFRTPSPPVLLERMAVDQEHKSPHGNSTSSRLTLTSAQSGDDSTHQGSSRGR
ncbi:hypothetical protein DXG01_004550 [Tephrocybe rancida]|nr:hypothetical protein DXG01_004550 [Tephrocybe rancida]